MSEPRGAGQALVLVGGAMLFGNGGLYLLTMIAARVLTPEGLGALLELLIIIPTFGLAT